MDPKALADQFLALLRKFAPHNWRGNVETSPRTPHFDSVTHMDGGLNLANQTGWAKAVFVQAGVTHRLMAKQPMMEFGTQATAEVELDDVAQPGGGFVLSTREGSFGLRLIATWKFLDEKGSPVRYRFDGDILP